MGMTVWRLCFLTACFLCAALPVRAAAGTLSVNVNQSLSVTAHQVTQVSVANPEIADVVVISRREILLIGKKTGSTTLNIWTANGGRFTYEVQVGNLNKAGADQIAAILDYPGVKVNIVGDTVVLEGSVDDQGERQRAEKIAAAYSERVVNLLEITSPKQVRLAVKVLEISSDKVDKLGIQYGNTTLGDDGFAMGTVGSFMFGQGVVNNQTGHGWENFGSYADISATLSALVTNGDAEILSQPNLVTLSGEKANILVGGELPIPVAYDDNKITVEWKEYGIKLDIEPLADSEGRIRSTVKAEVSNIDNSSGYSVNLGGGFVIPALRTRRAESVVDMPSGATMAIGGLISSEDSTIVSKVPLLGDLPVLGQFFRHTQTTKARKEIIILVTPTLTSEEDAGEMSEHMQAFRNKVEQEAAEEKKLAERNLRVKVASQAKADGEAKAKAEAKAAAEAKIVPPVPVKEPNAYLPPAKAARQAAEAQAAAAAKAKPPKPKAQLKQTPLKGPAKESDAYLSPREVAGKEAAAKAAAQAKAPAGAR